MYRDAERVARVAAGAFARCVRVFERLICDQSALGRDPCAVHFKHHGSSYAGIVQLLGRLDGDGGLRRSEGRRDTPTYPPTYP